MRRLLPCLYAVFAGSITLSAATVTHLQEDWRIQSACKLQATGDAIAAPGFSVDGWLKTAVPSTVLAAQVAAGAVPDPYFGDNLRQLPGTGYPVGHNFSNLPMPQDSPYRCGWWYRKEFAAPAAASDGRIWLHFGGINYRGEIWLNGTKVADSSTVAGAYRTYDFDVTDLVKSGKPNILAVKTMAPTEKDLGINWVDWNPCPPDKDMGVSWGCRGSHDDVGRLTRRSPMAVTHFGDGTLDVADLTIYAELHNATDKPIKGVVTGTAAGVHFEQPVELAAHEDREIVFTPEQFAQLKIHNPKLWWPYQMGEPHLERLTMSFNIAGHATDEQSIDFGIREITSEFTATGGKLFRVNGKPILIRGGGWSQDMLLRTDANRLRDQFRLVRDIGLNTIRLEGKLDTEDFFQLADRQGVLVMLGWCCCDHWEHREATDSGRSDDCKKPLSTHRCCVCASTRACWCSLNGSDNPPPADVEKAYLQIESETHWPNPILSSATQAPTTVTGPSGVKMTGPYDYVAPSYWYVDTHNGGNLRLSTRRQALGPAIPSLAEAGANFYPIRRCGLLPQIGACTTGAEDSQI